MRFYQDKIALRELFTRCNERRKDRRDERLTPLKRRILWSPCKNTLNGKGSHAWTATLHLYFLDSLQHVDSLHRPEFTKIRCYITKITDWISRLCFFKDISSSNCGKDTEVAKKNHNNSNFRILQEIFRECFFRFQIKTSSNCWLLHVVTTFPAFQGSVCPHPRVGLYRAKKNWTCWGLGRLGLGSLEFFDSFNPGKP